MAKKGNTKYRVKANKEQISQIIVALVYIALGVLFCIFQAQVASWLVYVVGGLLILKGVIDLFVYRLTISAAIELVLGIVAIVLGATLLDLIAVVVGVVIAVYGVMNLVKLGVKDFLSIVVNVLLIVAGVMLATNPGAGYAWMFIVIGIVFIVDGVIALVKAF